MILSKYVFIALSGCLRDTLRKVVLHWNKHMWHDMWHNMWDNIKQTMTQDIADIIPPYGQGKIDCISIILMAP